MDTLVNSQKQAIFSEDSIIHSLLRQTANKENSNAIDSAIANRINRKLFSFAQEIGTLKQFLKVYDSISISKLNFNRNYRSMLVTGVPTFVNNANNPVAKDKRMQSYAMIQDLLDRAKQNLFNLAAFFGPGEYQIPESSLQLVKEQFEPLIDSIADFSNKYKTIDREAVISFYGYADGQPISTESVLADTLSHIFNLVNASSEQLNGVLSNLRANAMSEAFNKLYGYKKLQFLNPEKLVFVNVVLGLGEKFPNPRINDYQTNDERRRIVLFYWGVLPR